MSLRTSFIVVGCNNLFSSQLLCNRIKSFTNNLVKLALIFKSVACDSLRQIEERRILLEKEGKIYIENFEGEMYMFKEK